jgi:hypothetical protein
MATITKLEDIKKAYEGYLSGTKSGGDYRKLENFSERAISTPNVPLIEISDKFHSGTILFIGFNPSGADTNSYAGNTVDVFIYTGNSPYYQAMESFAKECGYEGYSELDVLGLVRKTQSEVVKHFLNNPSLFSGMLNIFLDAIFGLKPSVIVVANAFVRKLLVAGTKKLQCVPISKDSVIKKLGKSNELKVFYNRFTLSPNNKNGGYTLSIDGKFKCQLFFSCMLSGQRAIDLGNRENLVWLVKNYLAAHP